MAASVQGWRTKWFYVKDRKASPGDEYGLAPFDASKKVKKLASWDSLPSDEEIEQIVPLLSRIQALKGGRGGALSGIQLMAFFVQRRVQPLQHRLTKLWSYSGLEDSARISEDLMKKQDVDKRVRGLTKLTKDHAVAELAAGYFDSVHPLPEVHICLFSFTCCQISFVSRCVFLFLCCSADLFCVQEHQFLVSRPPLPEVGPLPADLAASVSEAPEAEENQDGDDVEESEEDTSSTTSPPHALSEDAGVDKKRKRVDEFASSSSSLQKTAADKASVLVGDIEYFDLLAS
jgi:hypothetical protein